MQVELAAFRDSAMMQTGKGLNRLMSTFLEAPL
jgi:hypothetical protein